MLPLAPLVLSLGLSFMDVQPAPYVDRIAAVVGDHVILLSEVRARAAMVARAQKMAPSQIDEAALHEVTESLVTEQLEQDEAERLKITASPPEIDEALEEVAQRSGVTVAKIVESAKAQGLSEPEFRAVLRIQVLEAKLLKGHQNQLQRIEDKDLRARYEELKKTVKDPNDLRSFEELKPQLAGQLLQERLTQLREDWLAQLRARTYVEVRVGGGS